MCLLNSLLTGLCQIYFMETNMDFCQIYFTEANNDTMLSFYQMYWVIKKIVKTHHHHQTLQGPEINKKKNRKNCFISE